MLTAFESVQSFVIYFIISEAGSTITNGCLFRQHQIQTYSK
jgi:hypothetical protein